MVIYKSYDLKSEIRFSQEPQNAITLV